MNVIIEGDEHSVWAYLTNLQTNEVIMDGFLCSVGRILSSSSEVEHFIDSGIAPPTSKGYSNEHTLQPNIKSTDLEVKWADEHVKALAQSLENQWQKLVGNCELVFTRNPKGRSTLLKARFNSLASEFKPKPERTNRWK